jgi:hypothetical protein
MANASVSVWENSFLLHHLITWLEMECSQHNNNVWSSLLYPLYLLRSLQLFRSGPMKMRVIGKQKLNKNATVPCIEHTQ